MTSRTTVIGAVAAAFFAASVGPVVAQDKRVRIQNNTGYAMVEFYGSNAGTDDWEEDILGADILPPGGSVRVNFEDGTGYCMFDFKAVFEDGDVLTRSGVDVCKTGTFKYN